MEQDRANADDGGGVLIGGSDEGLKLKSDGLLTRRLRSAIFVGCSLTRPFLCTFQSQTWSVQEKGQILLNPPCSTGESPKKEVFNLVLFRFETRLAYTLSLDRVSLFRLAELHAS